MELPIDVDIAVIGWKMHQMQKPVTSTGKIKTQTKNFYNLCAGMLATCMDWQCHKSGHYGISNGEKICLDLKAQSCKLRKHW